jgi:hypothetical protein
MGEAGRRLAWVAAALLAAAAGAAWAQADEAAVARLEAPSITRGAGAISQRSATPSGAQVLLFHYFNVAPDCSPSEVSFRLATPPAHGAVTFVSSQSRPFADGHPLFVAGDPRARCADRLVPTRDAIYTPAPGFSGQDSFVIEASEAGAVASDAVDVSVLSFGKPFRARYPE